VELLLIFLEEEVLLDFFVVELVVLKFL
jgi:hypothetical protein